jgi:iron complex outermembrane receptor protein
LGQNSDTLSVNVEQLTISATRIKGPSKKIPLAFSIVRNRELSQQNISLKEQLISQPGIFTQSSMNYAQDLRISMRGFGARSAFGIRGIKLIVDGVPETTPDGQGQVDNINLQNIDNIEIIHGLAGGLYGNASGGVIRINSMAKVKTNFVEFNSSFGSFETQNYNLRSGLKFGATSMVINGRYFNTEGFRDHSKSNLYAFGASLSTDINEKLNLRFLTNYTNSPTAQDPGGLTIEDINENKRSARDRNIEFNAGESINHFKAAAFLNYQNENKLFKSSFFFHNRNFDGRLPFSNGGIVNLQRKFYGNSTSYQILTNTPDISNLFLIGTDIHFQHDDRQRFVNDTGTTGSQTLNQLEVFNNLGLYVIDQVTMEHFLFNFEFRYDGNNIILEDNFLLDGDQSSSISYDVLNYTLGTSFLHWPNTTPFLRLSTNFETPTLSELSSNPIGAGFNEELNPTRSKSIEVGLKGDIGSRIEYKSNLFYINSTNEILPFELEEFPDRDFFRNTGKTERLGLESQIQYRDIKNNLVSISYTFSEFKFEDYDLNGVNLTGNNLPGIPIHTLSIDLSYNVSKDIKLRVGNQYYGHLYADNKNTIMVQSYLNNSLGGNFKLKLSKSTEVDFYFGINNLFNVDYYDNIRINAFGNRHYESGPGRNAFAGIRIRFDKASNGNLH